ncbi:hypothetical protein RRF57_002675 [Xylaria bambusicola]|uniref:Uncharacterized protein n=1 Tax=Xylaria bambusicola TaxID=326684 RepID=A0AAN7UT81_9PEZI
MANAIVEVPVRAYPAQIIWTLRDGSLGTEGTPPIVISQSPEYRRTERMRVNDKFDPKNSVSKKGLVLMRTGKGVIKLAISC